jgi:hypothetical protein
MMRGLTLKLLALAVAVVTLNAALWWAIGAIPPLKDQINWFALWAGALIGVGVVAVILGRTIDEEERTAARTGVGGVALLQAALMAGMFYWQGSTASRAPTIPKARFQVADNSPIVTHIGHIKVEGGNSGQLRYEFIEDHGDSSYNFYLHSSTGELTLARTEMMNAKLFPMFQLHVRATDAFNESGEGYVWVQVLDANQPPKLQFIPLEFNNYANSGDKIGVVRAFDPENDEITFRITSGNDTNLFDTKNSHGGICDLTINDGHELPRRDTAFELEIEASDGSAPPVSQKLRIDYHYHER